MEHHNLDKIFVGNPFFLIMFPMFSLSYFHTLLVGNHNTLTFIPFSRHLQHYTNHLSKLLKGSTSTYVNEQE